jgi:hypothetical protein
VFRSWEVDFTPISLDAQNVENPQMIMDIVIMIENTLAQTGRFASSRFAPCTLSSAICLRGRRSVRPLIDILFLKNPLI